MDEEKIDRMQKIAKEFNDKDLNEYIEKYQNSKSLDEDEKIAFEIVKIELTYRNTKKNIADKKDIEKRIYSFPIPSEPKYLRNKSIDYNILCGLVLISKFQANNENKVEGFEGCFDTHRYIYSNYLTKYKEEVGVRMQCDTLLP